jgi:Peptidase family M28
MVTISNAREHTPTPIKSPMRWPARAGLALALVGLAVLAATSALPPQPKPADVAYTTFSATRAMDDLEVIAAKPHPTGSDAQQHVRGYLVGQASRLGLPTEVQEDPVSGAQNVVVRLPGSGETGHDVLITAHYDSAPLAPGAADDGISVAALVETMRVLAAQPQLTNDLVFLFTDGEENRQTGIAAFVRDNPAAERISVAFAFEASPESGGTELRTTTPGDAWLVSELADASLPIFADSALNTSDRDRIGNDFAAFAPAGIVAAEFLTEGDVVRYHNAGDNVAAVDPGVVQDHGDTMVALAQHFGDLDLSQARTAEHDLVFLTAPALGLVTYPVWVAQALAVATAVAFLAVVLVWRRRQLRVWRVAAGAAAILGLVLLATALSWAAWRVLLALNPDSAETLHYPDFALSTTAMVVILAIMGLAYVVTCDWLSHRFGIIELITGALVWWMVLALLLAVGEPLFSPVGLWPLVGGIAALAGMLLVPGPWSRAAVLAVAAVPGLVVLAPLLVLETLNVEQGPLVAVPVLLLFLGALLPQLLTVTGATGVRTADEPSVHDQSD